MDLYSRHLLHEIFDRLVLSASHELVHPPTHIHAEDYHCGKYAYKFMHLYIFTFRFFLCNSSCPFHKVSFFLFFFLQLFVCLFVWWWCTRLVPSLYIYIQQHGGVSFPFLFFFFGSVCVLCFVFLFKFVERWGLRGGEFEEDKYNMYMLDVRCITKWQAGRHLGIISLFSVRVAYRDFFFIFTLIQL